MIKVAIDVRRAIELVKTIPTLGFNNDIVEVPIANPDLTNISVIINITVFYLRTYISFYNIHYQF